MSPLDPKQSLRAGAFGLRHIKKKPLLIPEFQAKQRLVKPALTGGQEAGAALQKAYSERLTVRTTRSSARSSSSTSVPQTRRSKSTNSVLSVAPSEKLEYSSKP